MDYAALKRNAERFPLFGRLLKCTLKDHTSAFVEFLTTVLISFLPILLAGLGSLLYNNRARFLDSVASNLQNGELFLYLTALLAPVFFTVVKKRSTGEVFPHEIVHLFIYIAIMVIAAYVFALRRVNPNFDAISISTLQNIIFLVGLVLFYLVLVYNNSLVPDPTLAMREEEDTFTASVREHRRVQ